MTRLIRYATDRQIIMGLLGALRLHPVINDPPIYYPVFGRNSEARQVFVDKYRTFGGTELIEPGLTIAMFPAFSSYNLGSSDPETVSSNNNFATFDNYNLGEPSSLSYYDQGSLRFVCQIYYRDSNFNTSYNVTYGVNDIEGVSELYEPYGDNFYTPEDNKSYLENWEGEEKNVTFSILPGEEVVRDYCYLVRSVLREIGYLRPFGIRGFTVKSVDYPSSDWIKNSSNIVFHTAYITIEVQVYETVNAKNPFYTHPSWGSQESPSKFDDFKSAIESNDFSEVSGVANEIQYLDNQQDKTIFQAKSQSTVLINP